MPKCRPVGSDFADTAPVTVRAEVELQSSPLLVWGTLADTPNWPQWFPGMKECRATSDPAGGLGESRFVHVGPLKVDERFVAWEPERAFGFTVTSINFGAWVAKAMLELVELAPSETGGTIATYKAGLHPTFWARPLGGRLRDQMAEAWTVGLGNIDGYLHRYT